jgi:tRNA-splicing ligase RtcB
MRGVAEEASVPYKEIRAVVDAAAATGLARKVATLSPIICVKC